MPDMKDLETNNVNVVKDKNANSNVEQNQEAQGSDVKLTAQQYKALMTLLQQQGSSSHNSSHVNQIELNDHYLLLLWSNL